MHDRRHHYIHAQNQSGTEVFSNILSNTAQFIRIVGALQNNEQLNTTADYPIVDTSLDIYVPNAILQSSSGNSNIWFNLEFYGADSGNDYIWKLKEFGENRSSEVLKDFVNVKDPTRWEIDESTGLRFRYITEHERQENGWLPGPFTEEDNYCDDGIDNDGDGLIDGADPRCKHHSTCNPLNSYPFHVHKDEAGLKYGLLGDITWCTRNKEVWLEELDLRAQTINQAFDADSIAGTRDNKGGQLLPPFNQPHAEYNAFKNDPGIDLKRYRTGKCWILPMVAMADACKNDKNACGPYSPGSTHEYPYGGLKNARINTSLYLQASWKDLEHAAKLPANQNMDKPLDLWQIITSETGYSFSPEY